MVWYVISLKITEPFNSTTFGVKKGEGSSLRGLGVKGVKWISPPALDFTLDLKQKLWNFRLFIITKCNLKKNALKFKSLNLSKPYKNQNKDKKL